MLSSRVGSIAKRSATLALSKACWRARASLHRSPRLSSASQTILRIACSSLTDATQQQTMGAGAAADLPQAVAGLEPAALWRNFAALSAIPRPSKDEGRVLAWLKDWAGQRGLEWQQDAVGNIVIRHPGSCGGEAAPTVVMQGHVDMVCEKNEGTAHDFTKDGIRLVREGDWLAADGTTLGADNGIGVATALAVLELPASAKLPPIEALFTVDEETGMTGAFQLDGSMLHGRVLLNLDTEDWGEVFIGCAGGGDTILTLQLPTEAPAAGATGLSLRVHGLMGGHSGLNIHEDRGNALRMTAALVEAVLVAAPGARLASIAGGDKRNAIPRECSAQLAVPQAEAAAAAAAAEARAQELREEYGHKEAGLAVAVAQGSAPAAVVAEEGQRRLLDLLLLLPHGPVKKSHAMGDMVETSSNLASIRPSSADGSATFTIQCSTRSSLTPALEQVRRQIARVARLCGAQCEQDEAYPGWAPNPSSQVVGVVRKAIEEVTGKEVEVKAIHAGLECGILGEKLPGCDSVSFGPTIRGAHSPDERVQISTVEPFFKATMLTLEVLADRRAKRKAPE